MTAAEHAVYAHQSLREVAYHEAGHAVVMIAALGETFESVHVLDHDSTESEETGRRGYVRHHGLDAATYFAALEGEATGEVRKQVLPFLYGRALVLLSGLAAEMPLLGPDVCPGEELWDLEVAQRETLNGDVPKARAYLDRLGVSLEDAFWDAQRLVEAPEMWCGIERLAERLIEDRKLDYDEVMAIPEVAALHITARAKVEVRFRMRVRQRRYETRLRRLETRRTRTAARVWPTSEA